MSMLEANKQATEQNLLGLGQTTQALSSKGGDPDVIFASTVMVIVVMVMVVVLVKLALNDDDGELGGLNRFV
eukprot:CAMPEP_0179444714 /NCGR_PEP_ID=MMETSP0799-20121207/28133_1 /TAXON_ID=46947 /ORGANISM="Geminigera cryophila, Strain CCMP2564" /LENGTH=71 /DNA_ID=CAMNT_0021231979 /DNA_START=47 /DNA_END=262 /DNA_ORIENTATION=+